MSKQRIFFFYQTPSFLAQKLYNSNQNINDEIVKHINNSLIELKKYINVKTIRESENPLKMLILLRKSLTLINNNKVKDFHIC